METVMVSIVLIGGRGVPEIKAGLVWPGKNTPNQKIGRKVGHLPESANLNWVSVSIKSELSWQAML